MIFVVAEVGAFTLMASYCLFLLHGIVNFDQADHLAATLHNI